VRQEYIFNQSAYCSRASIYQSIISNPAIKHTQSIISNPGIKHTPRIISNPAVKHTHRYL